MGNYRGRDKGSIQQLNEPISEINEKAAYQHIKNLLKNRGIFNKNEPKGKKPELEVTINLETSGTSHIRLNVVKFWVKKGPGWSASTPEVIYSRQYLEFSYFPPF